MSDYLWDQSGEPDRDIQKLEALLAPLGYQPRRRKSVWIPLALAASLALLCAAAWFIYQARQEGWQVHALAGNPALTRLGKGRSLITDARSRARLELANVGEVEVEPNTRLRVLSTHPGDHRLQLERGVIRALIWAPPGGFAVNTPSAVAVDLGCAYTLQVDDQGVGLVTVLGGWVAFESDGLESFIPGGATCETRPRRGPGIPCYQDAAPALALAVHQFDAGAGAPATSAILSAARPRDALTLWHLLRRVPPQDRARVYDRLAGLISIPGGVTRGLAISGDPAAIDALWNSLDLGDTGWWRMWKAKMPK